VKIQERQILNKITTRKPLEHLCYHGFTITTGNILIPPKLYYYPHWLHSQSMNYIDTVKHSAALTTESWFQ